MWVLNPGLRPRKKARRLTGRAILTDEFTQKLVNLLKLLQAATRSVIDSLQLTARPSLRVVPQR